MENRASPGLLPRSQHHWMQIYLALWVNTGNRMLGVSSLSEHTLLLQKPALSAFLALLPFGRHTCLCEMKLSTTWHCYHRLNARVSGGQSESYSKASGFPSRANFDSASCTFSGLVLRSIEIVFACTVCSQIQWRTATITNRAPRSWERLSAIWNVCWRTCVSFVSALWVSVESFC